MRWADCRLCRYFVRIDSMEYERLPMELRLKALMTARRRGEKLLGICLAYERGVTYYEGSCKRFKPKREEDRSQKTLLEWL